MPAVVYSTLRRWQHCSAIAAVSSSNRALSPALQPVSQLTRAARLVHRLVSHDGGVIRVAAPRKGVDPAHHGPQVRFVHLASLGVLFGVAIYKEE